MQIVGGETFKTQKDLIQRVREIKDGYLCTTPIKGEDFDFLYALFERHDNWDVKKGAGVKDIYIDADPMYGTRGFYITRIDGTQTDISFRMCLSAKKESPLLRFSTACRQLVKPDIDKFKASIKFPITCPYTGEILTGDKNTHIDHEPPFTFQRIRNDFITENNIDVTTVKYALIDNNIGTFLKSPKLEKAFIAYHRKHAKLRPVSLEANLNIIPKEAKKYD